jgi:hypothetical protein
MLTLSKPLQKSDAALALSIDATMREKLPALPNPIVAAWDERHRLVLSKGEPWIVGPLEIDPYLTKEGGYPFPADVADQLRRISDGGARFHRIAIAHEVDATGPAAGSLPTPTAAGVPLTAKETRALLGKAPAAEHPKALAASMDKAIKKAMRGLSNAASAAGAVLSAPLLDPIVFGVIGVSGQPGSGRPALYYPLAAWVW